MASVGTPMKSQGCAPMSNANRSSGSAPITLDRGSRVALDGQRTVAMGQERSVIKHGLTQMSRVWVLNEVTRLPIRGLAIHRVGLIIHNPGPGDRGDS